MLAGIGFVSVCGTPGENPVGDCTALFGTPAANTGLDAQLCRPERICDGMENFFPPVYTATEIADLHARTLLNSPVTPVSNPYKNPALVPENTSGFCAVLEEPKMASGYRLMTFARREDAQAAGTVVTHAGACGLCSSLQDLAVYIEQSDLTNAARNCALRSFTGGRAAGRTRRNSGLPSAICRPGNTVEAAMHKASP